jgi:hypothetical protein
MDSGGRNSQVRVDEQEGTAAHPRFSDYQHAPGLDTERSSNALIYENADVRMTAYSDRIVRRSRGEVQSKNRLSSIYGGNLMS